MPIEQLEAKITISEFIERQTEYLLIDVRTPAEYNHAHIKGAYNVPIFTNEQRVVIGTAYKQQGKQAAIKIGLDYFGPRMRDIVTQVEALMQTSNAKTIVVHCWRGGMRSAAMQWLLSLYGFTVLQLVGGYKMYRRWCIDMYSKPFRYIIVGGKTGTGKTHILAQMQQLGAAVLCLETIGKHKGSSFGGIGLEPQPTQEMWENDIAQRLHQLSKSSAQYIYVEDESQRLGKLLIPHPLWLRLRKAPLLYLNMNEQLRLENIIADYHSCDTQELIDATVRITKRLGFDRAKEIINLLELGNKKKAFELLLKHYDKAYSQATNNRENLAKILHNIECVSNNHLDNAQKILDYTANKLNT